MRATGRTLILVVLASCSTSSGSDDSDPTVPLDSVQDLDQIRGAPAFLTIGGRRHDVTAFVYRDFMPGTGGDRSALRCIVDLSANDGGAVDPGLEIVEFVITQDDRAWVVAPTSDTGDNRASASGGPRWEVESLVDVAVIAVDADGTRHFATLRAEAVQMTS